MFTISVESRFRASHQLSLANGSKEARHEHNWLVRADVASETIDSEGMVMDFDRLKAMLDRILARLDNGPLNRIGYFQRNNCSAENVAKYIHEKLQPELPSDVKLRRIRVMEQPGCWAEFAE